MRLNPDYEIVEIADEYLAVPTGEAVHTFHGVIALSGPAAFLLNIMDGMKTREELINLLLDKYDVTVDTINHDFDNLVSTCRESGLIID